MNFFTFSFEGRTGVVREMEARDISSVLGYWYDSTPEYLASIGVDIQKRASREVMDARYRSALPREGEKPTHVAIVVEYDGEIIGHTNSYIVDNVGYPHAHIIKKDLRHKGLASKLFQPLMKIYFEHYGLERLILEASPVNVPANAFLQGLGLQSEPIEVPSPLGMGLPGTYHTYELLPEMLDRLPAEKLSA